MTVGIIGGNIAFFVGGEGAATVHFGEFHIGLYVLDNAAEKCFGRDGWRDGIGGSFGCEEEV